MSHRTNEARLLHSGTLQAGEVCVHVTRDADGIFHFDYSRCSGISLAQVQVAHAEHQRLAGNQRTPVLLTGGHVGQVDYRAQRFASSPEVCAITSALAIVVTSFLERHLARLFLIYHRPPYPAQVFSSVEIARDWLRSYCPDAMEPPA